MNKIKCFLIFFCIQIIFCDSGTNLEDKTVIGEWLCIRQETIFDTDILHDGFDSTWVDSNSYFLMVSTDTLKMYWRETATCFDSITTKYVAKDDTVMSIRCKANDPVDSKLSKELNCFEIEQYLATFELQSSQKLFLSISDTSANSLLVKTFEYQRIANGKESIPWMNKYCAPLVKRLQYQTNFN